ncbi:hypothetical protein HANVADRAFT_80115 [Hanseniaspora valbyensis NRRL Y-1626]|uniref:Uncharacterized protein n=1 Tax=Hanseniaspora valbyensis NRRL Y-1626 TaxID=766949 RepID=A0A1B7TCB3_9ASCO|nr:hypothetical protein HANVADRAFT_80115 [Hanseniaspora valbyensis NRRL Y-1626]
MKKKKKKKFFLLQKKKQKQKKIKFNFYFYFFYFFPSFPFFFEKMKICEMSANISPLDLCAEIGQSRRFFKDIFDFEQ